MIMAIDIAIVLVLLAVAYVDFRRLIIPDSLSLGIAILALLGACLDGYDHLLDSVLGAMMAFVMFEGTRRVMSRRLQREAMGFGDVKLMTAGAIWIGASQLAPAILLACGSALLGFLVRMLVDRNSESGDMLPFGPFLAIGLIGAKALTLMNAA